MATHHFTNTNGVRYRIDQNYLILSTTDERELSLPLLYGGAPIDPNSWSEERLQEHIEQSAGVRFTYGMDAFGQTCTISFEYNSQLIQFSLAPPVDFEIMTLEEFYELYQDAIHETYLELKEGIERSIVPSIREADLFQLINFYDTIEENSQLARAMIKEALERNTHRIGLN